MTTETVIGLLAGVALLMLELVIVDLRDQIKDLKRAVEQINRDLTRGGS